VLGNGELLEFDSPHVLLSQYESQFSSLVEQTGVAEAKHLRMLANVASRKLKSKEQKLNDYSNAALPPKCGEYDPLIV
jgi:ATP-binding cassette subfamily C (CFTR/MRP) protein 1